MTRINSLEELRSLKEEYKNLVENRLRENNKINLALKLIT